MGRKKYSKGREVGARGIKVVVRRREVGLRGREAGIGDPPVHPHIFLLLYLGYVAEF